MATKELDDNKVNYEDLSAAAFRSEKPETWESNFWNEPFPDDLTTLNGNTARFNKSYKKTHTALNKRKCSIKLELELSSGAKELVDVGTFLISKVDSDSDEKVTLSLEDLVKPLMSSTAEEVKSGFQWYRNVPLKFLVEELIKKEYGDPRNGEIPKDFIIDGIRPKNPSTVNERILSSLGRPPIFTKLTNDINVKGKCRVICKGNVNDLGEYLYLGIDNQLWKYDEINQIYSNIGTIAGTGITTKFNIKKLWFNSVDKLIYGIAWPEEELVNDEFPEQWKYSCPIGNEFIIFKANNDSIVDKMFDSTKASDVTQKVSYTNTKAIRYKLFSGEYHIVPPYFVGKMTTVGQYREVNSYIYPPDYYNYNYDDPESPVGPDYNYPPRYPSSDSTYVFQTMTGMGHFSDTSLRIRDGGLFDHYYPRSENIAIPFAQKIGFSINRNMFNFIPPIIHDVSREGQQTVKLNGLFGMGNYKWNHLANSWYQPISLFNVYIESSQASNIPKNINHSGNKRVILSTFDKGNYEDALVKSIIPNHYGIIHSIPYKSYENQEDYFPVPDITLRKFDPGFLAYSDDGIAPINKNNYLIFQNITQSGSIHCGTEYNNFSWKYVAWPWLKYTSGQTGAITFLPNYGNKGGIFIPVFARKEYNGNYSNYENTVADPTYVRLRCMTQNDLHINSSFQDAVNDTDPFYPRELGFKYYVFDLETGNFHYKSSLEEGLTSERNGKVYPCQITSTAVRSDGALYVGLMSYTNKNGTNGTNTYNHHGEIRKILFDGIADNCSVSNVISDSSMVKAYVYTDLQILNNGNEERLFASFYDRSQVVSSVVSGDRPTLGNCFAALVVNLSSHEWQTILPSNLCQYSKFKKSLTEANTYYYIKPLDRHEDISGVELWKFSFYNNFALNTNTKIGSIGDVAFGESNNLSNLEIMQFGNDPEVIYGVSDAYYPNPINKTSSKNYLWKYDIYLSGVVELADFSGMTIWDALSELAQGFNYITGFDGDKFFFIPKNISSTPDMTLDLDLDKVLNWKKTQDYDIFNIIKTVPYRATKGDIEWSIVLCANETNENDEGRVKLSASLKIRQDDDLTKDIILKTLVKGNPLENVGDIRMGYLIYNNVIETRIIRDIVAGETKIYIPSFFGDNLDTHLGVGDIIAIQIINENEESQYITRIITNIDFDKNEITINSAFTNNAGTTIPLKKDTQVSIHRGFNHTDGKLRNNSWSQDGVTTLQSNYITWVNPYERAVDVMSIKNLGERNYIRIGNIVEEFVITKVLQKNESPSGMPRIQFTRLLTPFTSNEFWGAQSDLTGALIRAYWVPVDPNSADPLVEVGGSRVFLGFEPGSAGTFWFNSQGNDRIEIRCPGLKLEKDSNSAMTVVDLDSVNIYGKLDKSIDDNRFIQINLLEFLARNHLHWKSKPKLSFEITNLIQALSKGGMFQSIPAVKLLNNSERKLFTVRIYSKKILARFPGNYVDCYILSHKFDLKTFTQALQLQAKDPY